MTKGKDIVEAKASATLPLPLNKDQLEDTANKAAALMQELDEKDEAFKLIKREKNAELKDLRLRMRKFLEEYAKKSRDTEVECKMFFDLKNRRTWYEYKGKKYLERVLDEYELEQAKQQGLFGDGPDLPGIIHEPKDPAPGTVETAGSGSVVQGPF